VLRIDGYMLEVCPKCSETLPAIGTLEEVQRIGSVNHARAVDGFRNQIPGTGAQYLSGAIGQPDQRAGNEDVGRTEKIIRAHVSDAGVLRIEKYRVHERYIGNLRECNSAVLTLKQIALPGIDMFGIERVHHDTAYVERDLASRRKAVASVGGLQQHQVPA